MADILACIHGFWLLRAALEATVDDVCGQNCKSEPIVADPGA